ncbi:hypothetical protein GCM10011374_25650 [Kocuria dechangensis]|uniref:SsuA/THI5-like domain-containing protein n=1 Tax=Kocuria dechangensis TaxID=1176249 RepID=A0A917GYN5_9MICC|nr:ABC transporter substrate-binding protein [Kocuria dechangensis]GGG61488.1 hypothetical protein GCM10011374_25650 [Kocuria dechangensis]
MKRRAGMASLALVGLLGLSGCGVGKGSAVALEADDPVKIGVLPVADCAPIYVALEKGYFEDEGIEVQTQTMQNAAAVAPSVINGQLQYGCGAITPILMAAEKGLPIKVAANLADVAEQADEDVSALLVPATSAVQRPRELEGKTVGVNGLGSILHVTAAAAIKADGGDPSKVTFVAMSFPDLVSSLKDGRIEAASVVEPFVGMGMSNGAVAIERPYHRTLVAGETMSVLFTADPFVHSNPEVVEKVRRAIERASITAGKDPQVVRDVLVEYGGMKPEVAERMGQPPYSVGADEEAISHASRTMVDLGFMKELITGDDIVLK